MMLDILIYILLGVSVITTLLLFLFFRELSRALKFNGMDVSFLLKMIEKYYNDEKIV